MSIFHGGMRREVLTEMGILHTFIEKAADRAMYASKRMALTTVIAGDPRNRSIADALQSSIVGRPCGP